MRSEELDISSSLTWEEGLPRPQWDLINTWVESRCEPDSRQDAWDSVVRQWLAQLGEGLGGTYESVDCDHFVVLTSQPDATGRPLLEFAEQCRAGLLSLFDGVVDFDGFGKQVVVALRNQDDYYRYICQYFPEGEHGGSGGVHIREGYPHVALYGKQMWVLQNTLAHELTHVSLHHLSMPLWLEEGLAQMIEHDMTGRSLLMVDGELARRHKRYWGKHGLDNFWRGQGFGRPGKVQELNYQLAEILVRLLVEQGRPRWLGWDRGPQRRFFAFLRGAKESDCGEEACMEHLGFGLSDLAGRFLGQGAWSPSM
jgi:hypothetical protein